MLVPTLYTRYPIVARALGLAAAFRPSSSIHMSALYEELRKSDAPIFLTVYEALHMKIYEAPHMNFGELRSPGSAGQYREAPAARREAPGSVGKHPQRRTAFGNCGNKLKY